MTPAECVTVANRLAAMQLHGTPIGVVMDNVLREWARVLAPITCNQTDLGNRLVEECERWPSLKTVAGVARACPQRQTAMPGTFACRCGPMGGWVHVGEPFDNVVRPCEFCKPDQFARWKSGEYAPLVEVART